MKRNEPRKRHGVSFGRIWDILWLGLIVITNNTIFSSAKGNFKTLFHFTVMFAHCSLFQIVSETYMVLSRSHLETNKSALYVALKFDRIYCDTNIISHNSNNQHVVPCITIP
jgi:hypothetical protein